MKEQYEAAYCKLDSAVTGTRELLAQLIQLQEEVRRSLAELEAAQQAAGEIYLLGAEGEKKDK